LLVIRILSPDDYGLMAVSRSIRQFPARLFRSRLGDALVQR